MPEEAQIGRAAVLREIPVNHAVRAFVVLLLLTVPAFASDHGFDRTTERSKFFRLLKRPDLYPRPCCGEADAYEADIYQKNPDGSYIVIITDGSAIKYPDGVHRDYIANGTKVIVPSKKVNPPVETQHNPTGHAWLFMSVFDEKPGNIFCFAPLPEGS
jgi:hypothetical protein